MSPVKEDRVIDARDGYPLKGTIWVPDSYDRVVIIGPAMGVKRNFYHSFAYHLMDNGLAAVTFDYRGIGDSLDGDVGDVDADVFTWAREDLGGVIRWTREAFPDSNLLAVFHSLSGQIMGLTEEASTLEKIVTVVTAGGYWNLYSFPKNLLIAFVWYGLYPLSTKLLGYFPGKALGLGENLPGPAALQISRWGQSPDYVGDYSTYSNVTAPVLAYSFTDDFYCPPELVDYIHGQYTAAAVTRKHVDPQTLGYDDGIGHFGFFREGKAPELWDDVIDWLTDPAVDRVDHG